MSIIKKVFGAVFSFFASIDKWILLMCLSLSVMSVFFLYQIWATGTVSNSSIYKTQLVASLLGIFSALFIAIFDYNTLLKFWKLYLPVCVLLVVATFVLGVERGSNKAWLFVPIMGREVSLQPSELLKISFISTFALHLDYVGKELNSLKNIVLLVLHGGAHVGLILLQRDTGTAIIFVGIFVIMLISAGLSWKYITLGAIGAIIALLIIWYGGLLSADQIMRFKVLADPTINKDYAYQQAQGLKALGIGGMTGVGFKENLVYVPEAYNDFMFTFIGQTTGIIGCTIVIIILLALCMKLVYNGNSADNTKGRMINMGFMAMVAVQSIMNIGMCINVLPVIGVPLPFLSSGGSSMVAIYLGVGLCLSVYRYKKKNLFSF